MLRSVKGAASHSAVLPSSLTHSTTLHTLSLTHAHAHARTASRTVLHHATCRVRTSYIVVYLFFCSFATCYYSLLVVLRFSSLISPSLSTSPFLFLTTSHLHSSLSICYHFRFGFSLSTRATLIPHHYFQKHYSLTLHFHSSPPLLS